MEATFCFVDLAGFTALTAAHGDDAAADLITRFGVIVEAALEGDAAVVDMIGDAAFLVSEVPEGAIGCVARIFELVQLEPDFPALRAGLHHGDAVLRDDRWIGTAVNVAARVAGQARGGQVLATAVVAARAAARGTAMSSSTPRKHLTPRAATLEGFNRVGLGSPVGTAMPKPLSVPR